MGGIREFVGKSLGFDLLLGGEGQTFQAFIYMWWARLDLLAFDLHVGGEGET